MLMSVLIVLTGCLSLHKESNVESLLVPEFDTTLVFPDLCWVYQNGMYCISKEDADKLSSTYPNITFYHGDDGLLKLIENSNPDMVVNALVGFVGLAPTLCSLENNKILCLANKESLVVGGELVNDLLKQGHGKLYPIDSEHVALAKCLSVQSKDVKKLIITASGGAFRKLSRRQLRNVTPEDALKHPTWNMGPKISIDSSTLANKGLEVIEAHYLFGFDANHIEVTIHPQSVVHSMVRTLSGQVYSQMSPPDMVFPIMRALLGNEIDKPVGKPLDFSSLNLTFEKLDFNRFPFVEDAYECVRKEGVYPTVFNVADEIAVEAFCQNRIKYTDIQKIVRSALQIDWKTKLTSLEDVQILTEEIKKRLLIR